jgi:hypothetical protein
VPATAVRRVTESEVRAAIGKTPELNALRACLDRDAKRMIGSMSGWLHDNLVTRPAQRALISFFL